MATERRLGRGLGTLLGGSAQPEATAAPHEVPLDQIDPNPHQPRAQFEPEGLEELRDSIRNHGVLQPVILRRVGERYQLIAGERRWRAARLAGLTALPATVREQVPDGEMLEIALVENVQRRDLDAIERARGYRQMMERIGLTQEQVAQKVGLKRATVANHLRLLELPQKAQEAVSQGLISMGHARALLALADRDRVLELVERAAREGLSVRRVEELVRAPGAPTAKPVAKPRAEQDLPPWARELEERMREHLGTRVVLRPRGVDKGSVVIDYFNRESLDRLCELLAPRPSL